jgi:hypothetical protein
MMRTVRFHELEDQLSALLFDGNPTNDPTPTAA